MDSSWPLMMPVPPALPALFPKEPVLLRTESALTIKVPHAPPALSPKEDAPRRTVSALMRPELPALLASFNLLELAPRTLPALASMPPELLAPHAETITT